MNKVILIGNVTKDIELKKTQNDVSVAQFTVAVARTFKNQNGEQETDFLPVTVWRAQAENCAKYLKKGSKVAVCGSVQIRSYEDKDGNKRYATDIVANEVEFLTPKSENSGSYSSGVPELEPVGEEDLPF